MTQRARTHLARLGGAQQRITSNRASTDRLIAVAETMNATSSVAIVGITRNEAYVGPERVGK